MEHQPKIIAVTGGNKGVGFQIVCTLAKNEKNSIIYLCSRNEERGQAAISKLIQKNIINVKLAILDVTSVESIKNFKESISTNHGKLDILICNAGVAFKGQKFTENIGNTILQTNFLAVVNLYKEFEPIIPSGGKIINVSSELGQINEIEAPQIRQSLIDINNDDELTTTISNLILDMCLNLKDFLHSGWRKSYVYSKIGVSAFTKMKSNQNQRIKIVAATPGWCKTDMSQNCGPRSPKEGADTICFLAQEDNLVSGKLYMDRKEYNWY